MSLLIDFYLGDKRDTEGRYLLDLWKMTDEEFELVHDWVQWAFPLPEPSQFNPDAPLLTPEDVQAFRTTKLLQEHMAISFALFLRFLGLKFENGLVVLGAAPNWPALGVFNHNWLRISRVLACLRLTGLEDLAGAFYLGLDKLYQEGKTGNENTMRYWKVAALGDLVP